MPISGLPGRPTTQGKNERSHQTLIRFLDANQPASLDQLQRRINIFREHYNKRRPHQALGQATPAAAWELLEHTPATSPIPLVVLEAKAAEYRQLRNAQARDLDRSRLTVSKTGETRVEESVEREGDQSLVEVIGANRLVYYHGYHVKLPSTYADREFYRRLTVDEFSLADPRTGPIVFSIPLPLRALNVRGRYVSSYAVRRVQLSHPIKHWERKHAEIKAQFDRREEDYPEVFIR